MTADGAEGSRQLKRRAGTLLLSILLLTALAGRVLPVAAFSPRSGDSFHYSETITVGSGQGSYAGYSDQSQTTGSEEMTSVAGKNVSASYSYHYEFSNNQGSSTSDSHSGTFIWSTDSYTYLNGTDGQVGYSYPVYVWFAMNPSLGVGDSFDSLNTHFTVLSKNYSFQLPTEGGRYVQTIEAAGTGEYQRNDGYGVFAASYTWRAYYDPTTGYIVGYHYLEQDTGQYQGQSGSFTYSDDLYVTSTSYSLAAATPPANSSTGTGQALDLLAVAATVVLVIALVAVLAVTRRGRRRNPLPEHSAPPPTPPSPPPPAPWSSNVDLGSEPAQQVVIRDVAKVACAYCGTLIPTTVDRCPYCGGPRR